MRPRFWCPGLIERLLWEECSDSALWRHCIGRCTELLASEAPAAAWLSAARAHEIASLMVQDAGRCDSGWIRRFHESRALLAEIDAELLRRHRHNPRGQAELSLV